MVNLKMLLIFVLPIFILTIFMGSQDLSVVYGQSFIVPEEKPTISVSGSAEKEVQADESKISLAVENTNANANTARKNNADKMNSIIEVLKQNGLTDENITTSNFRITPNYDYEASDPDRIISYTALNMIELKTSSNTNISKFIDLAISTGANRVENIEFVTSKKTLDKVSLELLKEALNNAKEKASILAVEGNFTIAGIKQIDASVGGGTLPPSFSYSDYAGASTAAESLPTPSTQIISAKNKITVILPVTFYIVN
ncbi:MAG TPA: SIMPL domain-containing protein [Candidatus Nitrosocosmicus sp.]|nr:SIMPL domain-containing protein [Candidatus Nitrosocosmicus sp.]